MPPPDEEIDRLHDALKRLAPQPANFSRDALLFAAGQASTKGRIPVWFWPSVSGLLACVCLVLTCFLISPTEISIKYVEVAKTVYVERPAVLSPQPKPVLPPLTSSELPVLSTPVNLEVAERQRMWQIRQEVMRWGVEMLPPSKMAEPIPSPSKPPMNPVVIAPPTFAIPGIIIPKKRQLPDLDWEELD